ncbi:MAG: hypothetical protein ABI461_01150 [Polyangiaceae bacterium]
MVRSLALAVLLSLPLVACASLDGTPQAATAGGASGGSPGAGSPSSSVESQHVERSSARELSSNDRGFRHEFRSREVAICRQCR